MTYVAGEAFTVEIGSPDACLKEGEDENPGTDMMSGSDIAPVDTGIESFRLLREGMLR